MVNKQFLLSFIITVVITISVLYLLNLQFTTNKPINGDTYDNDSLCRIYKGYDVRLINHSTTQPEEPYYTAFVYENGNEVGIIRRLRHSDIIWCDGNVALDPPSD